VTLIPPVSDDELAALWYSEDTAATIAGNLRVSQTWLIEQWKRLRASGKLPHGLRRNASRALQPPDIKDAADGRPDLEDRDLLLDALVAAHGPEGRPDLVKIKKRERKVP
jgi:hypothetical protein